MQGLGESSVDTPMPPADSPSLSDSEAEDSSSPNRSPLRHQFTYLDATDSGDDMDNDSDIVVDGEQGFALCWWSLWQGLT